MTSVRIGKILSYIAAYYTLENSEQKFRLEVVDGMKHCITRAESLSGVLFADIPEDLGEALIFLKKL